MTKMGSIIGQKIDYNGVGALRGQLHIPSCPLTQVPPRVPFEPTLGESRHLTAGQVENEKSTHSKLPVFIFARKCFFIIL